MLGEHCTLVFVISPVMLGLRTWANLMWAPWRDDLGRGWGTLMGEPQLAGFGTRRPCYNTV